MIELHNIYPCSGGIFNLEFSPDGRILSAACERKNIMIFDPLTRNDELNVIIITKTYN